MDIEERARRLFQYGIPSCGEVAEQLRAVQDEAEARMAKTSFEFIRDEIPSTEVLRKEGKREGMLRAAEILEKTEGIDRQGVADSIRKEAGEL